MIAQPNSRVSDLQPACRIHGGTDDGEFEPVQPDVSEDDLAVMQSDADPDRRLAAMPALAVQIVDRTSAWFARSEAHFRRRKRRGRVCRTSPSIRRQDICPAFLVPENLALHPFVEAPQRPDHFGRAAAVGVGGEADDVGEKHRHVLGADLLERLVVFDNCSTTLGEK